MTTETPPTQPAATMQVQNPINGTFSFPDGSSISFYIPRLDASTSQNDAIKALLTAAHDSVDQS